MENTIIEVDSVEKSFRKLKALGGISFEIERGVVTAILGPNASGKTTLLKCILGLMIADRGEIRINGSRIKDCAMYRRLIGYMPQVASFPDNVSPSALMALIAHLRGRSPVSDELIELFDLGPVLARPVRELSGGTKQKISALCALSFGAEILILDEPTVGLDPVSSIHLKEKILHEKHKGTTVLLTSHVMTEVEELAANVVFLLDGKVRFKGPIKELQDVTGEARLERAVAKLMIERQKRVHA